MKRREFVQHSAAAAAGIGLAGNGNLLHGILVPSTVGRGIQDDRDALAATALDQGWQAACALLAWASALTDIRATHSRMEFLMTRSLVRCVLVSDRIDQPLIGRF